MPPLQPRPARVGTYPISSALVDPAARLGKYTVTLNNGTLTVTPALLTVTGSEREPLVRRREPDFTGTFAGTEERRRHHCDVCQRGDRGQSGGDFRDRADPG